MGIFSRSGIDLENRHSPLPLAFSHLTVPISDLTLFLVLILCHLASKKCSLDVVIITFAPPHCFRPSPSSFSHIIHIPPLSPPHNICDHLNPLLVTAIVTITQQLRSSQLTHQQLTLANRAVLWLLQRCQMASSVVANPGSLLPRLCFFPFAFSSLLCGVVQIQLFRALRFSQPKKSHPQRFSGPLTVHRNPPVLMT